MNELNKIQCGVTDLPRKVLVLGRGKSGEAAAARLRADGAEVSFAEGYDLVVASPGLRVVSELQYGCAALRRAGWKLLAVTGSKGKSSVVKLVAEALGGVPCGNYGTPVSALLSDEAANLVGFGGKRWAVVEVSSFMLETTVLGPDTFEAAAILNLQEDHLDRHGSVAVYHALKRRLLDFAKRGFGPFDSTDVAVRALMAGSYFDNGVLAANGAAAVALLRAVGLDDGSIRAAFAAFRPLPHRMNEVGVFGGVRCIDDSKATSLAALAAGVSMVPEDSPVRLIAGGLAKGDDPGSVLPLLTRRVKKVYLIGCCAEKFKEVWASAVSCEVCETMERAVCASMRDAVKGETVLLSPGTASFDQFKSFGERGEVFADLVKREGQKK